MLNDDDDLPRPKKLNRESITGPQKNAICLKIRKNGYKFMAACEDYDIPKKTLARWLNHYDAGMLNQDAAGGQPSFISEESKTIILQKVQKQVDDSDTPNTTILNQMFQDEATKGETLSGNGLKRKTLSQKQKQILRKELKLKPVTSEGTTAPRTKTKSDLRMFLAAWVALWVISAGLEPSMKTNWDATQFALKSNGKGQHFWAPEGMKKEKQEAGESFKHQGDSDLDMAIKLVQFGASDGTSHDPVIIVADDSMAEGAFRATPIVGMCSNSGVGAKGWLIHSKTRAGNSAFYNWYAKTVVIPYFIATRAANGFDVNVPGMVSCDGEAIVLSAFQEAEIIELFKEHNIDGLKFSASGSALFQPWDLTKFFANAKREAANPNNNHANPQLEARLKAAFAKHILESPPGNCTKLKQQQSRLIDGILKIVYAIKVSLTHRIAISGFEKAGFILDPTLSDYEQFRTFFSTCTAAGISRQYMQHLWTLMPKFYAEFEREGQLTDAFMTKMGVPITVEDGRLARDMMVLWRQRAVIWTKEATIARLAASKAAKLAEMSRKDFNKTPEGIAAAAAAREDIRKEKEVKVKDAKAAADHIKLRKKEAKDLEKTQEKVEKALQRASLLAIAASWAPNPEPKRDAAGAEIGSPGEKVLKKKKVSKSPKSLLVSSTLTTNKSKSSSKGSKSIMEGSSDSIPSSEPNNKKVKKTEISSSSNQGSAGQNKANPGPIVLDATNFNARTGYSSNPHIGTIIKPLIPQTSSGRIIIARSLY